MHTIPFSTLLSAPIAMDLGSFYAQQGQLEGLRQLHWMLLDDPSDSGLLLGEAIAREKLARSGIGGICGLAPNSVAIVKRRQKQWRKTDLMIARLERQRTTNAHQEVLVQRGTGRVFVPLEELFDTLQRFHAERGHSSYRVALYAEAGTRFANVGRELLCDYLNGFEQFLLDAEAEETTMVALAAAQGDARAVQKEE